jgi:hypothetical protein
VTLIDESRGSGRSLKTASTWVGAVVTVAPLAGTDETSSA